MEYNTSNGRINENRVSREDLSYEELTVHKQDDASY